MGRDFLDTNVLVYLVDRSEPRKQELAERIWRAGGAAGDLVLSAQVLNEFYSVTTRVGKRLLPPSEAEAFLIRFAALEVVPLDAALVLSAAARVRGHGVSLWDALIVEAALAAGCTRLLTEDLQHGRVFDGLRVEDPFRGTR